MTTSRRAPSPGLLAVLVVACAHTAAPPTPHVPVVQHQADEAVPPLEAFAPGPQRETYYAAQTAEARGDAALRASNTADADAQYASAAARYEEMAQRFPETGWSMPLRVHAAELDLRAKRWSAAAALADAVAADAAADDNSRAVALLVGAEAQVRSGAAEPLRFQRAQHWGAAPPAATEVPVPWVRFRDAADRYLDGVRAARSPPRDGRISAALLAWTDAQIHLAEGDFAGAARTLRLVLEDWPEDAAVFTAAAPSYLDTFVASGDRSGYEEALALVHQRAEAAMARAGADADAYRRMLSNVDREHRRLAYETATDLLGRGHAAEAASAFEALSDLPGADRGAALNDAATAWDRAGDAPKAASDRERIVSELPGSTVAPGAALALAAERARAGNHAEAARVYALLAERWPQGPHRCAALRNGAIELDRGERPLAAAARYVEFGRDARCAASSPNAAALSLYRAGTLYRAAKLLKPARQAFRAAASIATVSDPDAKRAVVAARKQIGAP